MEYAEMKRLTLLILCSCVLILSGGCGRRGGGANTPPVPTRSFLMGFPALPYAFTAAAIDDTWAHVNAHSDMVMIHLENGVPWEEAYTGAPLPANVETELNAQAARILSDKQVLLASVCMDTFRENLCGSWTAAGTNQARAGVWATRNFASQEIADAYVAWMEILIARYNPDFVNYGVEATELSLKDPAEFLQFQIFAQRVYTALKTAHPTLPIFFSFIVKYPGSADAATVNAGFTSIKAYTDYLAVSTYAFAFYYPAASGDPANLPADWLTQAIDLAPDKPFAIAETSWIAEDLVIPAWSLNNPATPEFQRAYVERLMAECDRANAVFVIWFVIIDYDELWRTAFGSGDLARLWRDTGLFDENRNARPVLTLWDQWLARDMR